VRNTLLEITLERTGDDKEQLPKLMTSQIGKEVLRKSPKAEN
jgi:hypothetical protein